MIIAIDVDYRDTGATAAGVCFNEWTDSTASNVHLSRINDVLPYEPGYFFRRELPCIKRLLAEHQLSPSCIVVDGFVDLGAERKPGLGLRLYNELDRRIPVVGVAKKAFKDTSKDAEIYRGESNKPLFVSTVGYDLNEAKALVQNMHGKHRIPTLLKLVDSACRNG